MKLSSSELILNDDGSIYHLNLQPGQVADTIITVGDPERVAEVSTHFDTIEVKVHKREFVTHTGMYRGKRLTVISTGIGTDNIDIVFNELDALVNIDFEKRTIKENLTSLSFARIGTTGAIQEDIPLDTLLVTEKAIGFDSLLHYYDSGSILDSDFSKALSEQLGWDTKKPVPCVVDSDSGLFKKFQSEGFQKAITATQVGFYGPQGRSIRLPLRETHMNEQLRTFLYRGKRIDNLEMETSGIYGMAMLLGHRAISLNAVLANRATGKFSEHPKRTVATLIKKTLDILVQ